MTMKAKLKELVLHAVQISAISHLSVLQGKNLKQTDFQPDLRHMEIITEMTLNLGFEDVVLRSLVFTRNLVAVEENNIICGL